MTTDKVRAAELAVEKTAREMRVLVHGGNTVQLSERRLANLTDALFTLDAARSEAKEEGFAQKVGDLVGTAVAESRVRQIADEQIEKASIIDRLDDQAEWIEGLLKRVADLESKAIHYDPSAKAGDCYTVPQPIERDTYDPPGSSATPPSEAEMENSILRARCSKLQRTVSNQRAELRKMQKRASTIEAEVAMRLAPAESAAREATLHDVYEILETSRDIMEAFPRIRALLPAKAEKEGG